MNVLVLVPHKFGTLPSGRYHLLEHNKEFNICELRNTVTNEQRKVATEFLQRMLLEGRAELTQLVVQEELIHEP